MPEKLFVSILEGRDLASKDSNGLSDPFVKVKLGKGKHATKILYKTLNPKYDGETFTFDVTTLPNNPLRIECWDHDNMSSDDFMGKFELNIADIQAEIRQKFSSNSGFIEKWYPLQSRGQKGDGEITGDLRVKLEIISQNTEQKSDALFYKWFPEIPHTETVIKGWLCAREGKLGVPTTGHLHLTQNYICFHPSNMIVTSNTVVISLKEVKAITKHLSNLLLPTGIEVNAGKKYWFSGFVHRNIVYRMIEAQWKNGNAINLVNEIEESDLSSTAQPNDGSAPSEVPFEDASSPATVSAGTSTPPPQRTGAAITLHIQPENTPELSLSDPIPIKLNTPASVRDLFAAIHDKVPQDIVLNDLISSFEFAIPKKKKGFELSINPLNVALNVGHTVTSMVHAGFASRRKVKLVLEESKPLTFYNVKDGDTLILRKKVTTKTLTLKFEIPEKKDLVTAAFDSSAQVKVIMEELGKQYNAEYVPGKYHMMLAKQGSRGIIMEPEGILGNYLVTEHDILRIKKSCPVTTVADIYESLNGEFNQNAALYELACHSLLAPVSPKKIDLAEAKALIKKIQDRLEVPDPFAHEVEKRIEFQKSFVTEVNLIELFHRLSIDNSHPFYTQSSFEDAKKFEEWKESEKSAVTKIVNNLIFKPEVFFGMLTVTGTIRPYLCREVLEATNVVAVDLGGKSDPYCILQVDGEKKTTRSRKTNHYARRTLNPVWNETFVFGVQDVDAKLQITVMDHNNVEQDIFLAKLDIPLRNISNGVPVMGWFNLPTKGKLRLHMQFSHQYSKYIHMLTQGPVSSPESTPLNYHELFKQLLQILIEFDNGEKDLLSENSTKLLDEFANRYGIGTVSRLILDLDVLSRLFKPNEQYIGWLEKVLNDIDRLQGQDNFSVTKTEDVLVTKAASVLLDKLLETVEQYKELYPKNNPPGALANIVESVGILKQLKKSDEKPSTLLIPAIKTSLQARYDQLLREIADKHPGALGAPELLELIEKIKVEHEEDLFYENIFPSDIDVVGEASRLYLAGLQEKVAAYCAKAEYSQTAMDLFFKIRELERSLDVKQEPGRRRARTLSNTPKPTAESTISSEAKRPATDQAPDPFDVAFKPIFFGYLKDIDAKLRLWCEKACELDKGEPVSVGHKQSSSVVDVFSSIRQAFNEMEALHVKDTFIKVQFLEIINDVVHHYAKLQCQMIAKPIDQYKSATPFTFTSQQCVFLNNIQAARAQLDELVATVGPSDVEGNAASKGKRASVEAEALQTTHEMCVQNAFAQLKATLFEAQDLFVRVMRDRISDITQSSLLGMKEGSKRLSKPPPPPADYVPKPFTESVTQYLDAQLEVLSEQLDEKLFSSVMRRLWDAVVEDLVELVLPHKDVTYSLSPQQITLVGEYIQALRAYFHANGSGVALPYLDTSSSVIQSALSLYQKDTQVLLDLYAAVSEKPDNPQYPGVQAAHVVKILATRAAADKEAKVIVRNFYAKKDDKTKDEDKKIRDLLLLPASETLIDKYVCTYEGKTGHLILSSNYVCFDPLLGGGPDSEHQIALKFKDLTAIKKKRVMLVFAAIEVTTEDNKTYLFSSFVDRDGCLADIRLQITKKGNTKVVIEQ